MARGEYGASSVGNTAAKLPEAQGYYRSYVTLFRDRINDLDNAIQQADYDYATTYQTDFRPGSQRPGQGLDQSEFVFRYWQPFVLAWRFARPALLAGKIDHAATLTLASWANRYDELRMSAGGSWGLETSAPAVVIHGEMISAEEPKTKTPWWKIALGAGAVLGASYLVLSRPTDSEPQQTAPRASARQRSSALRAQK